MPDTQDRPRRPDLSQIATTGGGRDITRGRIDHLPWIEPADPVWREAGGWSGYDSLLADDQVAACFAQRRLAVVRRPWLVEPGGPGRRDRQAADLVRAALDAIEWDTVTDQMLHARLFGFAVAEVIWAADAQGVRIERLAVRDHARFRFGPDGALRLLTLDEPRGIALPERKFWVVRVGARHGDEPYGRGLAHALWQAVWNKRHGARYWGVLLEKFGAPTVVGKFHQGASEADRQRLLDAARAVMTDAGVILPEGVSLELLEAARGGQPGHEAWMRYWDAAIAKIILGQTMTTDDGASRAQAQVHWDVRQDIVAADADLIDASASAQWVRWLVEYNLPGAALPHVWRDMSEPEDLTARAEREARLAGVGIRLKSEAIARVWGDDYERVAPETEPEAAPPRPRPSTQAQSAVSGLHATAAQTPAQAQQPPEPDELDRLVQEATGDWQPLMEPAVAALQALLDIAAAQGLSAAELMQQLVDALPGLPMDALAEQLARAQFAARLAGVHGREPEPEREG